MKGHIFLLMTAAIGGVSSEIIQLFLNEKWQFIAIVAVVGLDLVFGVAKALYNREYETKKAFKSVWLLCGYTGLLATVLLIEKGFTFASFLSEAVLLPIIVFQVISIIKNMNLLGLISSEMLTRMLSKIDTYKNRTPPDHETINDDI